MKKKKMKRVYLIYRRLSKDDKLDTDSMYLYDNRDYRFFGWTNSKSVKDAFLQQRNKDKYFFEKLYEEEVEHPSMDFISAENMINIMELRSHRNGDIVKIFTTADEKLQIEKDVQKLFEDLSSFRSIKDMDTLYGDLGMVYVNVINNLIDKYADALHYIGYRPVEINWVYDDIDESYYYESGIDIADINYCNNKRLNGEEFLAHDPAKIIIYSFESVIKVLKDEF